MSELKVYKPYANRDGDVLIYHKGDGDLMLDDEDEIYLKEDADKVIAHNKYKRCVAMAMWCASECVVNQDTYRRYSTHKSEFRIGHFRKWHKRWLELANKFKEEK